MTQSQEKKMAKKMAKKQAKKMAKKQPQTTLADIKNVHFWVKDTDTGEIIDPYFPMYDFIKKVNGIPATAVREYQPFSEELRDELCSIHDRLFFRGLGYEAAKDAYENPVSYNCSITAFATKLIHPAGQDRLKVVVGAMGWRQSNGEMWWEFGEPFLGK